MLWQTGSMRTPIEDKVQRVYAWYGTIAMTAMRLGVTRQTLSRWLKGDLPSEGSISYRKLDKTYREVARLRKQVMGLASFYAGMIRRDKLATTKFPAILEQDALSRLRTTRLSKTCPIGKAWLTHDDFKNNRARLFSVVFIRLANPESIVEAAAFARKLACRLGVGQSVRRSTYPQNMWIRSA